ncbi:hypothetical protein ACNIZC_25140, partial [Escherichia coli]
SSKYIISIALSAQILLPFSRDPKTPSSGSSSPPHNATSRQHNMWCRIQLLMTLYVVSSP